MRLPGLALGSVADRDRLLAGDPVTGIGHLLGQPFIQHALAAGTAIALLSGLVGYFVVLRGQVFAGDALSHVAYTGALAALAAGVDLRLGLFAGTVLVGLLLGVLGGRAGADDAVIGVVGATAAEASQAVGALLLFALLAAPPAAALRLTSRPWRALALSGGLAVIAVWLGVALSYAWPKLPPSFTIMSCSTLEYLLAAA